jgi:hypothetical protein
VQNQDGAIERRRRALDLGDELVQVGLKDDFSTEPRKLARASSNGYISIPSSREAAMTPLATVLAFAVCSSHSCLGSLFDSIIGVLAG